jgi:hypothetical protein
LLNNTIPPLPPERRIPLAKLLVFNSLRGVCSATQRRNLNQIAKLRTPQKTPAKLYKRWGDTFAQEGNFVLGCRF